MCAAQLWQAVGPLPPQSAPPCRPLLNIWASVDQDMGPPFLYEQAWRSLGVHTHAAAAARHPTAPVAPQHTTACPPARKRLSLLMQGTGCMPRDQRQGSDQ